MVGDGAETMNKKNIFRRGLDKPKRVGYTGGNKGEIGSPVTSRSQTMNNIRMEIGPNGEPPNDLAGLRNQVRMIQAAARESNIGEIRYQLTALLDDLSSPTVRFEWATAADRAEAEKANRDSFAAG
jgi:hypothetical protein